MAEELKSAEAPSFKVEEKLAVAPVLSMDESLTKLARVGGYDFLEAIVDGADNLNPVRKAKKNIFLSDASKKTHRAELKKKLNMWLDLLATSDSVSTMVDKSLERAEVTESLLKSNLKKVLETTKELEESYRSVNLFYKNTEWTKLKNVSIMNASMAQLTDLDEPRFIDAVADELKQNFDRLDLRRC